MPVSKRPTYHYAREKHLPVQSADETQTGSQIAAVGRDDYTVYGHPSNSNLRQSTLPANGTQARDRHISKRKAATLLRRGERQLLHVAIVPRVIHTNSAIQPRITQMSRISNRSDICSPTGE